MKATLGKTVHYVQTNNGQVITRAAVVTRVNSDYTLNLCVFNDSGSGTFPAVGVHPFNPPAYDPGWVGIPQEK